MPIATIETPEGKVVRLEVPEGATEAQILDFVQSRDLSQVAVQQRAEDQAIRAETRVTGGRGIAGQRAQQQRELTLENLRQTNPALAQTIEDTTPFEAFLIGAGGGLTTLGRGLGIADPAEPGEAESFEQLQAVQPAAQAGEIVGEAAPFLAPGLGIGAIASTPARIAASGALGATEGGLISAGRGGTAEDVAISAGIGAAIGGGGEALLPVIDRLGRKVIAKAGLKGRAVVNGQPTPELQQALQQQGSTVDDLVSAASEVKAGDIAGNAQREAVFERLDMTPTEAQRTRDIDLFVEQQDQFRRTGRVRKRLDEQEAVLTEKVAEAVTNTGGTPRTADQTAIEAVTNRSLRLDDEINALYREARNRAGDDFTIRTSGAIGSLKQNAPLNTRSEGTVSAIRDQMAVMGIAPAKGFKAQGRISVNQAEELRQFANGLFDGANPQGMKVIRDFKVALDDDVFKVAGEDVFQAARKAKTNFERGLTKEAKNKFDRNRTSLVRDMLENRIAPEDFFDRAVKGKSKYKAADLMDLKRYLSEGTPEDAASGLSAWNDLRAETMQFIKDTAFTGPVRTDGTQSLSRAQLQKAFASIGNDKMRVLFNAQEREFLRDLAEGAALREPPPGTFTGSGPSSAAIDKLRNRINDMWGVGDLANAVANKVSEKRVLKLGNDAETIRRQNAKQAFQSLRKSQVGEAAAAVPFTIIPLTQQEEQ
jgi:hypothetical protein